MSGQTSAALVAILVIAASGLLPASAIASSTPIDGGEPGGTLDVDVTGARLSAGTILEGESVSVTARVENTGPTTVSGHEVELTADGEVRQTKEVLVPADSAIRVSFEETFDEAGEYDVGVNGESAGTLAVDAPADPDVVGAGLDSDTILAGESVGITATIENDGDRTGDLDVELGIDGEAAASRTVTVGGRESTTVSFTESFDEAGEYEVTVNDVAAGTVVVEEPADLSITDADLDSDTVLAGESVGITATVENDGDRAGTTTVPLQVDGSTVDETEVTVGGGESTTARFEWVPPGAGEFELAVGDVGAGVVTVDRTAALSVDGASLSESTITEGTAVGVTATVRNTGDRSGSFEVQLLVNGGAVATRTVELSPASSETVQFTRTFDEAGEYDIAVNGETAGTLDVESRSSRGSTATPSEPAEGSSEGSSDTPSRSGSGSGSGDGSDASPWSVSGSSDDSSDRSSGSGSGSGSDSDDGPGLSLDRTSTDDGVTVTVEGPTAGESVPIGFDLGGPSAAVPTLVVEEVEVTPATTGESFAVSVSRPTEAADERQPLSAGQPQWYFEVDTDPEATAVESGSVTFRIDPGALPANASPDDVHLFRDDDGEWQSVNLTHEDGTYRASVDDFDQFAVAVIEPGTVAIVDAGVTADWVRTGSSTTADVVVENPGDAVATETLTVTVDGEPVATRQVRLDPGETAEIEIEFEVDADTAGTVAVAVDDADAGTLEVGNASSGDPDDDGGATDAGSGGISPLLVVLLLATVALVGGAIAVTRLRD